MNAAEFLVEFTKAYGAVLANLWWPLVILVIFFSLLYYFDRSIGSLGRRKRFPLTWKNMTQIVSQLERQYLADMSPEGKSSPRQLLTHEIIQRAKRGVEKRDEQEVVQAMMALSTLGMHTDKQLPRNGSQENLEWLNAAISEQETVGKKSPDR